MDARTVAEQVGFIAVLLVGAALYFLFVSWMSYVREGVFPRHPEVVLDLQRELLQFRRGHAAAEVNRDGAPKAERAERALSDRQAIQDLLKALQRVLQAHWVRPRFGLGVQCEVVLMTRSPKDDHVTVGQWAIRRPHSLNARAANSRLYDETEAARLYREDAAGTRVSLKLISDTEAPQCGYHFVSENEQGRIRSTVLKPLYSEESVLLGFVVAHANRKGVFAPRDTDFWDELLDPMAADVATYIERIIAASVSGVDPPW